MPEDLFFADWFNSQYCDFSDETENKEKIVFARNLIDHLKARSNNKILEVGCRTGQISKAISDIGSDVTGVDFSVELINEAKKMESETLHFFKHDIRLPFWINYFDYALNLFNSFGSYKTLREHDNAIRSVSQSLKTNGSFVMDYLNIQYEEDHLELTQKKKIENFDFYITKWQDDENFYKRIETEEQGIIKEVCTVKLLKFSIGDFTDMFAYQGLQIQEVFGDYNFSDYDIRRSPRLIIVAKKIRR